MHLGIQIAEMAPAPQRARVLAGGLFAVMLVPVLYVFFWASTAEPAMFDRLDPMEPAGGAVDGAGDGAVAGVPAGPHEPITGAAAGADPQPERRQLPGSRGGDDRFVPDEDDAGREAPAGTERSYYAAFRATFARDPQAFRAAIDTALARSSVLAEKVAALRAWHDSIAGARLAKYESVLLAAGTDGKLRDYTLRFLGRRARRDPVPREMLVRFLETGPPVTRHRAEAFYAVLRWADGRGIRAMAPRLFAERDAGVVSRATAALRASGSREAMDLLAELQRRHPVTAVRRAIEDERRR